MQRCEKQRRLKSVKKKKVGIRFGRLKTKAPTTQTDVDISQQLHHFSVNCGDDGDDCLASELDRQAALQRLLVQLDRLDEQQQTTKSKRQSMFSPWSYEAVDIAQFAPTKGPLGTARNRKAVKKKSSENCSNSNVVSKSARAGKSFELPSLPFQHYEDVDRYIIEYNRAKFPIKGLEKSGELNDLPVSIELKPTLRPTSRLEKPVTKTNLVQFRASSSNKSPLSKVDRALKKITLGGSCYKQTNTGKM